ncbi:hypothetical protein COSO111634_36945 [Corallococcus soli]
MSLAGLLPPGGTPRLGPAVPRRVVFLAEALGQGLLSALQRAAQVRDLIRRAGGLGPGRGAGLGLTGRVARALLSALRVAALFTRLGVLGVAALFSSALPLRALPGRRPRFAVLGGSVLFLPSVGARIERHEGLLQGLTLTGGGLGPPGGGERILEFGGGLGGAVQFGGGLGGAFGEPLLQGIRGLPVRGVEAALRHFVGQPAQLLFDVLAQRLLAGQGLRLGLHGGDLGRGGGVDVRHAQGGQRNEEPHGEEQERTQQRTHGPAPRHLRELHLLGELVEGELPVTDGTLQAREQQAPSPGRAVREHRRVLQRHAPGAGPHEPPREARDDERGHRPDSGATQEQSAEHARGGGGPDGNQSRAQPGHGVEAPPHAPDGREHEGLEAAFFAGGHGREAVSDTRPSVHKRRPGTVESRRGRSPSQLQTSRRRESVRTPGPGG